MVEELNVTDAEERTLTWVPPVGLEKTLVAFGAHSHAGRVRKVNEDGQLAQPPVFLVADGMGGHRAGDVASAVIVEAFTELALENDVTPESVQARIELCQQRITDLVDSSGAAPGSTLVLAAYVVQSGVGYWLLANIGDSRAYLYSSGTLEQLSHDHSVVQEMIDAGEIEPAAAATHPERHVITRALGALQDSPADFSLIPVIPGSALLLCSDGITSEIDDATIESVMAEGASAQETAELLVEAALASGGRDNATAVVVRVEGPEVAATIDSPFSVSEDTIPGTRRSA